MKTGDINERQDLVEASSLEIHKLTCSITRNPERSAGGDCSVEKAHAFFKGRNRVDSATDNTYRTLYSSMIEEELL